MAHGISNLLVLVISILIIAISSEQDALFHYEFSVSILGPDVLPTYTWFATFNMGFCRDFLSDVLPSLHTTYTLCIGCTSECPYLGPDVLPTYTWLAIFNMGFCRDFFPGVLPGLHTTYTLCIGCTSDLP